VRYGVLCRARMPRIAVHADVGIIGSTQVGRADLVGSEVCSSGRASLVQPCLSGSASTRSSPKRLAISWRGRLHAAWSSARQKIPLGNVWFITSWRDVIPDYSVNSDVSEIHGETEFTNKEEMVADATRFYPGGKAIGQPSTEERVVPCTVVWPCMLDSCVTGATRRVRNVGTRNEAVPTLACVPVASRLS